MAKTYTMDASKGDTFQVFKNGLLVYETKVKKDGTIKIDLSEVI